MLHCAHGAEIRDFEIVDWRPFESVTLDRRLPHGAVVRLTYDFTPTSIGTHLEARVATVKPGNLIGRFFMALNRTKVRASGARSLAAFDRIVAEDAAAGRV
jgi:hypothetical protein